MSWFKKKKKDFEFAKELPKLKPMKDDQSLKIPDISKKDGKNYPFPSYESDLNEIKKAVDRPISPGQSINEHDLKVTQSLGIPKRKPIFPKKDISYSGNEEIVAPSHNDKSIFIKLDDYHIAKEHLVKVINLSDDAQKLLVDLDQTRDEEDKELESWKSDLAKIKDNLLKIDKKLFGG